MQLKISLLSLTFFLFVAGCNNDDPENNYSSDTPAVTKNAIEETTMLNDPNVIKVYIDKTGKITSGGNLTDLTTLDSAFSTLKKNKGTVYYSRDQVVGNPPAESMKIIELVAKYRLPVKFFTDNTFSKAVDAN